MPDTTQDSSVKIGSSILPPYIALAEAARGAIGNFVALAAGRERGPGLAGHRDRAQIARLAPLAPALCRATALELSDLDLGMRFARSARRFPVSRWTKAPSHPVRRKDRIVACCSRPPDVDAARTPAPRRWAYGRPSKAAAYQGIRGRRSLFRVTLATRSAEVWR